MKKISALIIMFLAVFFIAACEIDSRNIESIDFDYSFEEAYAVNETIDLAGEYLDITYDNETIGSMTIGTSAAEAIEFDGDMDGTQLDTSTPGHKSASLTLEGNTITFEFFVADAVVHTDESIQAAIDGLEDGGTIYVYPGTYEESLEIMTDNITLLGANHGVSAGVDAGERREESIIDANEATNAIQIGAFDDEGPHPDDITIDGFTVRNFSERGIAQRNGNGQLFIRNNVVEGPEAGDAVRSAISLSGGDRSRVTGNYVTLPEFGQEDWASAGILLMGTSHAVVEDNVVESDDYGIVVAGYQEWESIDPNWVWASSNVIRDNVVYGNIELQGEVTGSLVRDNVADAIETREMMGGIPFDTVIMDNELANEED